MIDIENCEKFNAFVIYVVNPHIAPIMHRCLKKTNLTQAFQFCIKMATDEILHRCQQV